MFDLAARPDFSRTIQCGPTADDNFVATFKVQSETELAAFDGTTNAGQTALLTAVTVGLDGIVDDAKAPIAFSPELLAETLGLFHVRRAMIDGYYAGVINPFAAAT